MFEHRFVSKKNENYPLENPLDKSDDRVPLPVNLVARLAFLRCFLKVLFVQVVVERPVKKGPAGLWQHLHQLSIHLATGRPTGPINL